MSNETIVWLNSYTLIGHKASRGPAWHDDAALRIQLGLEENHYDGAVPVDDVRRRLFNWQALSVPVMAIVPCAVDDPEMSGIDGNGLPTKMVEISEKRAIVRSDTGAALGVMGDGYCIHQYDEWLIRNVGNLIDDQVQIGSAGLLKGGAVAWVAIERPETIKTRHGIELRPNITATTSLNGSMATQYKATAMLPVCDNTLDMALAESGASYKVRHTRHSSFKVGTARESLGLVVDEIGSALSAEIDALCEIEMSTRQYARVLDELIPVPTEDGKSKTIAERKRAELIGLWERSPMVAPFAGTAFGVLQAVNTWRHHLQTVKGTNRAERNMLNALDGTTAAEDAKVLTAIGKVLALSV